MSVMATKYEPTGEAAKVFAAYKRHKEALVELEKPMRTHAVAAMRDDGATVGDMAKLTAITDEVFRRLAREHGIQRRREPTVGKDAKPKDPPASHADRTAAG